MTAPTQHSSEAKHDPRLKLFAARCRDLRERVVSGSITFVDAVDMAYTAAVWSGLADDIGDDAVQQVMARAFGTTEAA